jgi:hypothetical protein
MRNRIAGLLAVFCLVFAGCSNNTSVPYGILPVNKMYPIMWDMIEADQYANLLIKDSAHIDAKLERLRLYEQVLRSHDVSREKFQKSYNYYKEHPEITQILYDSLERQGIRYRTEAYAHPFLRPGGTPAPVTPPRVMPPSATPMFRTPPGRPGVPVIRPFLRPDTSHHKTRPLRSTPRKSPGSQPSSNPPAGKPAS